MKICSASTIEINGLTDKEIFSYFQKFGEDGWLDCEGYILIDILEKDINELYELDTFFKIDSRKYRFIIINLEKSY